MRCDDGCGQCCGPVPVTAPEKAAIERFLARTGVKGRADAGPLECPFYDGKCTIYPVRPFICQAFGHTPRLVCPRGYNTNIADGQISQAIVRRGPAVAMLGELVRS
jgi:hypothetical protein